MAIMTYLTEVSVRGLPWEGEEGGQEGGAV
jgi:hypothetical protein